MGGFGGLVAKDWHGRARSTKQMYGEVFGAMLHKSRAFACSRAWIRRCPLPACDVELVLQNDVPPRADARNRSAPCSAPAGKAKFLYVDTDLKIDLPEARVVLDRERLPDLGSRPGGPRTRTPPRRRVCEPV